MKIFNCREIEFKGSSLIEASAGTGKTYSIALLFLRMVLEGIKADSILTVTFTNAATAELKSRVVSFIKTARSMLDGSLKNDENSEVSDMIADYVKSEGMDVIRERLAIASRDADNAQIFTIHGFCKRIISENAFETGALFNIEIVPDIDDVIQSAVESFWRREVQKIPKDILEKISCGPWFSIEKVMSLVKGRRNVQDLAILPESHRKIPSWDKGENLFGNMESDQDLCGDLITLFRKLLKEVNETIALETARTGEAGFDDILKVLDSALLDSAKRNILISAMKKKYDAVLIDEFQDTDALQYRIFRTLFNNSHHKMFFIGDPKQAIYSFRNADVYAYLSAGKSIDPERKYTMNVNYRSSKRAVKAVNMIFGKESPFVIDDIGFPEVTSALEGENGLLFRNEPACGIKIKFLRSDKAASFELSGRAYQKNRKFKHEYAKNRAVSDVCGTVADMLKLDSEYKISDKDGLRNLKPSDIAVLVNSNSDAELVKKSFSKQGIPFVMASNASVFESGEAVDVETVLEAFFDFTPGKIKAALLTPFFDFSISDIEKLGEDSSEMEKWYDFFSDLNSTWEKHGFLVAFSKFLGNMNTYERIACGGKERKLTNVRHLMELVHRYEKENGVSPESTLRWFKEKMTGKKSSEDEQLRLESDENAVTITTIHKSKGLTYSVVLCPDLWRKSEIAKNADFLYYHDENGRPVINFNTNDEEARLFHTKETLSENLRLVYVALTRARYLTVVYWGSIYGMETTPFARLFHSAGSNAELRSASDDDMMKDLARIAEKSGGAIEVTDSVSVADSVLKMEKAAGVLKGARILSGRIVPAWSISSFSSITAHATDENLTEYISDNPETETGTAPSEGILAFPAGTKAGLVLHSVFENINWGSSVEREAVSEVLNAGNIRFSDDGTDMTDWVLDCVNAVLDAPVFDGHSLRDVKKGDIVTEMEFFYRSSALDTRKIMDIFADMISVPENRFSGFIRGFMDLVFRIDGRYYLVDWKSNKIGEKIEDFGHEAMKVEMKKHNYVLQYMLYLSALDRYLEQRDPNYTYEKSFGGVCYVFLRGVTALNGYSTGIYRDRPSKELLDKFKKITG